jgi:predicted nucleic acid-binding protein
LTIFADSSFIVSSYVQDIHSAEVIRRMSLRPQVCATPLNSAEVAHAIHQYAFRGKLGLFEARRAWLDFEQDCANGVWVLIGLPARIWDTSIDLARQHGPTLGVRTLDSLHVACALELKAKRFWTFDERQLRLAEAVGLNTNA